MSPQDIAGFYLGRHPSREESALLVSASDGGEPCVVFDPRFDAKRKNCILYTSCHAISLYHYLCRNAEFANNFNIHIIFVHRVRLTGPIQLQLELMNRLFNTADTILSHAFLGDYELMNVCYRPVSKNCKCLTYVPPNNAALWPVVEHFGERGVIELLKQGIKPHEIHSKFEHGLFEPYFAQRWEAQIGRLMQREKSFDIGISDFCERNIKECKLWFTENHPTYHLYGWIGSQFLKMLDHSGHSEEECIRLQTDATGSWNAWSETNYEFRHYGFKYPKRYADGYCGRNFYHGVIDRIIAKFDAAKDVVDNATSY